MMIRAPFSYRVWFLISVAVTLGVILLVMIRENDAVWEDYQQRFKTDQIRLLEEKIKSAQSAGDAEALRKWESLYARAKNFSVPSMQSTFLPGAEVRDLCQTCHLAMENQLFAGYQNPLKPHPAAFFEHHKPDRYGCTFCHHGQGMALTTEKAHGFEKNWPTPRVPLKYAQGLCLGCHETPHRLKGAEFAETGRKLFVRHGCYGCHKVRGMEYLKTFSTPLDGIAEKVRDKAWFYAWIKEPANIRNHTRMPAFRFEPEDLAHLSAYLAQKTKADADLADYEAVQKSAENGKPLFTKLGCIGCHSFKKEVQGADGRVPNLAGAGAKLNPDWVLAWIRNPAAWDPETPMPKLMLEEDQCRDLAAFVVSNQAATIRELVDAVPDSQLEAGDPGKGKYLVQTYGCAGCHAIKEMAEAPLVGEDVTTMAGKRLDELPFGNAKIPETKWDWLFNKIKEPDIFETEDMPLKMPDFMPLAGFDEPGVHALVAFYMQNALYDVPEKFIDRAPETIKIAEKSDWLLDHFNCRGCHEFTRDQKVRIADELALKSMVPPRLVGEGERAQPQWLFQFLSRPVMLRPWLDIRMPDFNWGYGDKADLIRYLAQTPEMNEGEPVQTPYVRLPVRDDFDPEVIEMGEYRVTNDKCVQCHPVSMDQELPKDIKTEDLSINLMLSKSRLRYEWLIKFLRNPDKYAGKGTKMPFVYYTPDGVPRISNPEMWIEYSALYLMFMEKVPEMPKEEKVEEARGGGSSSDWTSY